MEKCIRTTSAPILLHPDPNCQFMVEVDVSDVAVGAVMQKEQKLNSCTFFFWWLSPAEVHYNMGNREQFAVVLVLQTWRHYLKRSIQPFIVWTDHKNLSYLCNAKQLNSR